MKRFIRSLSAVRVGLLACAVTLLIAPSAASAADIAWTATRTSFSALGEGRTTAKGTAAFKSGDKADTVSTCATGPKDGKGWVTVKCNIEYTFPDGSALSLATDNTYDEKTLDATGSATFTGGKGRFEGISGKATGTGLMGKMDWTGSYSLPPHKK